jgi:chromosome segregation ATPase
MTGLFDSFRKGRDAAFSERGYVRRGRSGRPASTAADSDASETAAAPEETAKLLTEVSDLAEKLQKQVGELETERDDTKALLAELVAEGEQRQQRIDELKAERDDTKKLLAEVTASAEQLQQRVEELETVRALLAEILLFPGVRKVLLKVTHEDMHPDADAEQRAALKAISQKVNAAYELIAPKKAPP